MRNLIISAAVAASALAVAAPAAAQYYPQQQTYGYQQGYNQQYNQNQGYGYQNNWGQGRALIARVDRISQQIRVLDRRNILSQREAYRLNIEAQQLRYRIAQLSNGGINPNERYDTERRLARLEQAVRVNAYDRNGRYNDGRGSGFGGDQRWDNHGDRDGREDRDGERGDKHDRDND